MNEIIIEDKRCPLCNGQLTLIKGKYGIFIGCSNYPNCTYTERIKENADNSGNRSKKR
ncbi:MAG TPA: topoisomerase DNA-binding C4 zinc finger domain-containing protein [bacterium]|nr:topoisomerase DNA-binding C4 zinc finger domain-containing protein [bacterium]